MNTEEVTRQIIGAWDEVQEEDAAAVDNDERELPEGEQEQPDADHEGAEPDADDGEATEVPAEQEEAEGEEEAEEASEEDGEEDEEEEAVQAEYEDPEVQAFLRKYQGNVEQALKAATHQLKIISQLGQDKGYLNRRVQELEAEIANTNALAGTGIALDAEQQQWVQEAAESGNPQAYVQNALRVGEFDLARAVCDAWAQEQPYDAMRARQVVDQAHQHAFMAEQEQNGAQQSLPTETILGVLLNHYPDMPKYEQQMVQTIAALGEGHPLVENARSTDPETQAYGILGIYEIARAQTATLQSSRDAVKTQQREDAAGARRRAKVSSSQATPSPGETPRPRRLGPGLTLEQLDAEWERD